MRTYVGADGKLHFTDASGIDTVLSFSSNKETELKAFEVNGVNPVNFTFDRASSSMYLISDYEHIIMKINGNIVSTNEFGSGVNDMRLFISDKLSVNKGDILTMECDTQMFLAACLIY